MPLEVLLILVVGGIVGIAVLTWALGWATALRLSDPQDACRWWDREWPERPARGAVLASDGHAALIETSQGPGLVWVMGADCTARPLDDARVLASDAGLEVHFPDMATPHITIHLDDQADRATWAALITEDPAAPQQEDPAPWAT